ncbi:MAG: LptA/OstA family protein [Holosporaceae bacterium]
MKINCTLTTHAVDAMQKCLAMILFAGTTTLLWGAKESSPLLVRAKGSIHCSQSKGVCTAKDTVYVKKDLFRITADKMTLHFAPRQASFVKAKKPATSALPLQHATPKGASHGQATSSRGRLQNLAAAGHVAFYYETLYGQGDQALYDAKQALITLKGRPLLQMQDIVLTSHTPVTFHTTKRAGHAQHPRIVFTSYQAVLICDDMHYFLKAAPFDATSKTPSTAEGDLLDRIDLQNNILLATPLYTLKATSGLYDHEKNTIFLKGKVQSTKGKHIVEAEEAVYNLKTQRLSLKPVPAATALNRSSQPTATSPIKGVVYLKKPAFLAKKAASSKKV